MKVFCRIESCCMQTLNVSKDSKRLSPYWEVFFVSLFAMISLWTLYHYFFDVRPWFQRLSFGYPPTSVMLPADPHVYWRFSNFLSLGDLATNVFGPTLLLKLFGSNVDLAFLFNVFVSLWAIAIFSKGLGRSFFVVGSLLFANPLILSQIFYPNKELYMFISSLFFLGYIQTNKKLHLLLGILLLPFTKTEYILIIVLWLISRYFPKKISLLALVGMILCLSAFYNFIPGISGKLTVLSASESFGELGLTAKLQYLSANYHLFFAVIIPKILSSMVSGVVDFIRYPDSFTKGFTTVISSVVMTAMAFAVLLKTKLRSVSDEQIFLGLWFIAVATVPFSLHRYLFPCYPFLYSILLKVKHE